MSLQTARWAQPWMVWSAIAYWSLLFMATHLPKLPRPKIVNFDKFAHFLGFWLLSFLLAQIAFNIRGRTDFKLLIISLGLLVYAMFDEISQASFGRTTDLVDLVADALGILAGIASAIVIGFRRTFWKVSSNY